MCLFPFNDTMFFSPCRNETVCNSDGLTALTAACILKPAFYYFAALFPSDVCPLNWYTQLPYRCQCDSRCLEGRCVGKNQDDRCTKSCECQPGLFCDRSSKCAPMAETCHHDEVCPRDSLCLAGKCTKYFSLPDGSLLSRDDEIAELLCQSAFASPADRSCAPAPVSSNKERKCSTDKDCSTSAADYFGRCQCVLGKEGEKKCAPVRGDEEGQQEAQKFKTYIEQSKAARRELVFNPVDEQSAAAYKEYRCARVKYRWFVGLKSQKNLGCLDFAEEKVHPLTASFSFFQEYSYFCFSTLLLVQLLLSSLVILLHGC